MAELDQRGKTVGEPIQVTVTDLIVENADDPGEVIAALWQLREYIRGGDWESGVTIGGGASPCFELTPVHPGEIALAALDAIGLGADHVDLPNPGLPLEQAS
jgi:hypothetical protein